MYPPGERCDTEVRTAANGFFPSAITPLENPFYLDLPYDDLNDPTGFADRCATIPRADDPGYAGRCDDGKFNGAGMDVSPALNGCLGFASLDGDQDRVSWQFVDDVDVPDGPWKTVVTTSGVTF